MTVLAVGQQAPVFSGITREGPHAVFFYKVTCPTCQMTAPYVSRLEEDFGDVVVGVGQDSAKKLETFAEGFGLTVDAVPDTAPYEVSNAYGIENVPTLFVIDQQGMVADVVESWDRDGYNRAAKTLARLTGSAPVTVSDKSDGMPAFQPG